MKNTIFRIILIALTASLSLASCTKEMEAGSGNGGTSVADGVREFTLSFTTPTKSAPGSGDDGWQHPVFSEGDVIKVSNATESEDCTVTGSGSTAKIRTSLSGTLKAVYPSTAAILSNGTTGYITRFKVSAAQDGTFAAANICMAENIAENATSITFVNKTALFKVTPPSDVTQFTVTSLNAVEDGVARTGDAVAINSSEVVLENKVITVSNTSLTTFYVSLLPGAKLSDLSFDAGEAAGMKGIPEKDIQTQATAQGKTKDDFNTLAAGKAYTINNTNWHPYVIIGGLKWATMNIGATSPTEAGKFFAWGSSAGYANGESGFSSRFSHTNCPYTNGSNISSTNNAITKYITSSTYAASGYSVDNKTTLELNDDGAYAYWGGAWRMPVKSEIEALWAMPHSLSSTTWTFGTSPNQIQLGIWGYAYNGTLTAVGTCASIWSSTLYETNTRAYRLCLDKSGSSSGAGLNNDLRSVGQTIRPVADL